MLRFKHFIKEEKIKYPDPEEGVDIYHNKQDEKVEGKELNGVKFSTFKPPKDWNKVEGQDHTIHEPPIHNPHNKKIATGVLLQEPDGRVWLTRPTNAFGGYHHTFPKGKVDPELNYQANALKELHEETGLHAHIIDHASDHEGDTSVTRYYFGKRVGGNPQQHGWESEAVLLVPPEKLRKYLNRDRDKLISTHFIRSKPEDENV
jgi:ADP-ribose pyrophosphatase YjhB (NUDIX family)